MMTNADILAAANESRSATAHIQDLYQQLPETTCRCEQPGTCCVYLPEMTLVEALQWMRVLGRMPEPDRLARVRLFVEYYLGNPLRRVGCPFLTGGNCGIYPYRPFACRAYGLWSKTLGDERTRQSREEKVMLARTWQRFGIELEADAIPDEMDYCLQVGCRGNRTISDSGLMSILQKIYLYDRQWKDLQAKFEDDHHSDFSFLMASMILGPRKAALGKLSVVKHLAQTGSEHHLENLLSQIRPARVARLFSSD